MRTDLVIEVLEVRTVDPSDVTSPVGPQSRPVEGLPRDGRGRAGTRRPRNRH
jgi:hypothetical protein